MRILSAAIVAAFFTAGSLAAYAQAPAEAPATAPAQAKPAKVKCSKKTTEADCAAPKCTWTPATDPSKPGKCSKTKKAK